MTPEEALIRLESPPKLNTQTGPMFRAWSLRAFRSLPLGEFQRSCKGVYLLNASEEDSFTFVRETLRQALSKRPDLVAKVKGLYILGEAKWVGEPGGNQGKQVDEVLRFCSLQRGAVRRVGIVDGFPWAVFDKKSGIINNKEAVKIQESEYDVLSALLLRDYFQALK